MRFDKVFFKELFSGIPDLPKKEKIERLLIERENEIYSEHKVKEDKLLFLISDEPQLTTERGKEIAKSLSEKFVKSDVPVRVTSSIGIFDIFFFHKL